ncbi:MAG: hypothetical protein LBP59_09460 [Planctomycetaceae bacterium]|nr:hypothetical protein [Planctomycetaceae bacterium]
MPSPSDRGRLACKRLYSTANERGYIRGISKNSFFCKKVGGVSPLRLFFCTAIRTK